MSREIFIPKTFQQLIDEDLLEIGDGYRAKNSELGGNGPIFLRAGHVTDSYIDFSGVERFKDELVDQLCSKMSRPGDTIITTKGNSTGRTSYVTEDLPPFVYSPHLSFWRSLNHNCLAPGFLRYWARGPEFQSQLTGMKFSTDMAPYLSLSDQRRLKISLPSPYNQHAIARILGSLDDKIELNRQMNHTLEAMAAAIFKSWFVDFDPVVAKAEGRKPYGMSAETAALFPDKFQDSEIGPIPKGWFTKSVYECATFINGMAFGGRHFSSDGSGLPVLKIAELKYGISSQTKFTLGEFESKYKIDPGDLLFSWSGSPETSINTFVWTGKPGWLNQHIFKIVSDLGCNREFVYSLMKYLNPEFVEIARNKQTTGLGHVTIYDLQRMKMAVPSPSVMDLYYSRISPVLEKSFQNALQSQTLASLRDILLPKLLSGDLRVKQAEKLLKTA